MLSIYLTSGPDRRLCFVGEEARLRHAPHRQLVAPHRQTGAAVCALSWPGPRESDDALATVASPLSDDDTAELAAACAIMPAWIVKPVSALLADGRGGVPAAPARPTETCA